jgi:hypothetical protein
MTREIAMTPNSFDTEDGLSRREFTQLAAVAAATAGLVGTAAADEPAKPAITEQLAVEAIIRQRYGKYLTEEQIARLTRRVLGLRFNADSLKRVPLTNGDEPAVIFQAD